MIIVCGDGSELAKNVIHQLSINHKVLAISRHEHYEGKNITSVNIDNYSNINNIIENINSDKIVWINFVAHSNDNLLVNTSEEDLVYDFELNFKLNFRASKTLLPKMIANKFGRFIFISSSRALKGDVGIFSYSLGKKATHTLQNQLVNEYSRFGITANTLSLGYYDTNLWNQMPDKIKSNLMKSTPTKKLSDPNCIAPNIELIIKYATMNNNVIKLDDGFQ